MFLDKHKILQENRTIGDLPDRPYEHGYSAQQLKGKFDDFPELLRQKHNALVDDLNKDFPDRQEVAVLRGTAESFAHHSLAKADSFQTGHVKIDNRSLVYNDAGQLCATGGTNMQVADLPRALAGGDNASIMTPYLVKEVLDKRDYDRRLEAALFLVKDLPLTTMAWRQDGNVFAVGYTGLNSQYFLVIYNWNGLDFQEASRLGFSGSLEKLAFSPSGNVLAVVYWQNALQCLAAVVLAGNQVQDFINIACPGGKLFISWQENMVLNNGVYSEYLAFTNQESSNYLGTLEFSGGLAGNIHLIENIGKGNLGPIAYHPGIGNHLALISCSQNIYSLHILAINNQSRSYEILLSRNLSGAVSKLQWSEDGKRLFLLYANADPAYVQIFDYQASGHILTPLLSLSGDVLPALPFAGCLGQNGNYLALVLNKNQNLSGSNAQYCLYFYQIMGSGSQLLFIQPLDYGPGELLYYPLGEAMTYFSASSAKICFFSLGNNPLENYLVEKYSFQAHCGGNYQVIRKNGSGKIKISCFDAPRGGQFFRFWGNYPEDIDLICPNAHSIIDNGQQARGAGLFELIYVADNGGYWHLHRLSGNYASSAQALAAIDDASALTPYTGALQIEKFSHREATIVVAANDSLHKDGADFICSGTSDQIKIQQALNALPVGGGKVVFLEGTYLLDRVNATMISSKAFLINCQKAHTYLQGMGSNTVFKLVNNSSLTNEATVILGLHGEHSCLENICFDGNSGGNNDSHNVSGVLVLANASYSSIFNCLFKNISGNALQMAALNCHLAHNKFFANDIGFYNVGGSSIIFANRFHNNKQVGLKNSSNAYDQISYNHFMNNTEIALQVCGNMYFRIFQNVLEGSKKGIYCQDCQKALVLDNTIRRAWDGGIAYAANEYAIYLENCSALRIIGNDCHGKAPGQDNLSTNIIKSWTGDNWNSF